MRILTEIVGWALIVVAGLGASVQLVKLGARNSGRQPQVALLWRVISEPAGQWFRIYLLFIGTGALLLASRWPDSTGTWLVVSVVAVILIWDRGIWLKGRLGRTRRRGPNVDEEQQGSGP